MEGEQKIEGGFNSIEQINGFFEEQILELQSRIRELEKQKLEETIKFINRQKQQN